MVHEWSWCSRPGFSSRPGTFCCVSSLFFFSSVPCVYLLSIKTTRATIFLAWSKKESCHGRMSVFSPAGEFDSSNVITDSNAFLTTCLFRVCSYWEESFCFYEPFLLLVRWCQPCTFFFSFHTTTLHPLPQFKTWLELMSSMATSWMQSSSVEPSPVRISEIHFWSL